MFVVCCPDSLTHIESNLEEIIPEIVAYIISCRAGLFARLFITSQRNSSLITRTAITHQKQI